MYVARTLLFRLFRREEPVVGGDSEPYTLHSYRSTSTPFIPIPEIQLIVWDHMLPSVESSWKYDLKYSILSESTEISSQKGCDFDSISTGVYKLPKFP